MTKRHVASKGAAPMGIPSMSEKEDLKARAIQRLADYACYRYLAGPEPDPASENCFACQAKKATNHPPEKLTRKGMFT